jgi:hypothetical protein
MIGTTAGWSAGRRSRRRAQFWVDVSLSASWAGIASGLLPLLSLGAVVVPRLALRNHLPARQATRARPLLIATLAAATVVLVSAALGIAAAIMVEGFTGVYRGQVIISVADAVGVALLAGVAWALAWFSLPYWPADAVDETEDDNMARSEIGPPASL